MLGLRTAEVARSIGRDCRTCAAKDCSNHSAGRNSGGPISHPSAAVELLFHSLGEWECAPDDSVGFNDYNAGSHIVLLADDSLFIQFDLPEVLRPGQTFLTNVEHRSAAKECVAANIPVNLVAAPQS
jgi:hypothetical protein